MGTEGNSPASQELEKEGSVRGILESFAPSQPNLTLQTAPPNAPSREVKFALLISIALLALGVVRYRARSGSKSEDPAKMRGDAG